MGKFSPLFSVGIVLLVSISIINATPAPTSSSKEKEAKEVKDNVKSSTSAKPQKIWTTAASKTLKRETLPIPSSKGSSGGKSTESLRTASQTLFGYNGANGFNGANGANGYNGFNNGYNGQFGYSPNGYVGRDVGGSGFSQYQPGSGAYNVLGQGQTFGGQGQGGAFGGQLQTGAFGGQGAYYTGNNYFGQGGFNGGYPYASTGGGYPFGNQGGFNGYSGGFNSGFYPGAQFGQGQLAQRNFGFVNQGFGNPAFSNPQAAGGISTSSGMSGIPSSVQVGTGLEVGGGSRGFSGNAAGGGFPSASGQQYIVGNGIGAPAFIGGAAPGGFGFGGPFGNTYSSSVPGGIYRQQMANAYFGPYDYTRRPLSGTSSPSTRPSSSSTANRLQTTGPNRFYQGASPSGTHANNSRERLYRYTSRDN